MMWGWDGWGIGGFIMMMFMVLFWAAVIIGIVLVVRALVSDRSHERLPSGTREQAGRPGALQILEERYARGEIDREEFLQRRQDLEGRGG